MKQIKLKPLKKIHPKILILLITKTQLKLAIKIKIMNS